LALRVTASGCEGGGTRSRRWTRRDGARWTLGQRRGGRSGDANRSGAGCEGLGRDRKRCGAGGQPRWSGGDGVLTAATDGVGEGMAAWRRSGGAAGRSGTVGLGSRPTAGGRRRAARPQATDGRRRTAGGRRGRAVTPLRPPIRTDREHGLALASLGVYMCEFKLAAAVRVGEVTRWESRQGCARRMQRRARALVLGRRGERGRGHRPAGDRCRARCRSASMAARARALGASPTALRR
jgi:hypothetical protein